MKNSITRTIIVIGFILTCSFQLSSVSAQLNTGKRKLTDIEKRLQKKVTVDFRETAIDDVILMLTKQADVDVVKSPKVVGNITATVTDIPLGEALKNILSAHGYAYVVSENMIRIIPASEIKAIEAKRVSKVYRITYADAKSVAKSLEDFLSKDGTIAVNAGTSNIMISDTEAKIKAIDNFILEVDRITPQIMVEARIYDISSKNRLDQGVLWSAGTNTTYDSSGNPINGNRDPFTVGGFSGATSFTEAADGMFRFGILNSAVNIDVMLKSEQEDIKAELLANPRVMVLDNEQANIRIISEIPYQELTQTAGGGNIGTTEFKNVGVELQVTPHVTRKGMIRMHIRPTFSIKTGEVSIGLGGTGITSPQPIVDTRQTDTITLVKDRQTIILGGLRKQEKNMQKNKVPFFGDLPLFGEIFKFEGEETITSELVVFITPRIIHNQELTEVEKKQFDSTVINPLLPDECEEEENKQCDAKENAKQDNSKKKHPSEKTQTDFSSVGTVISQ